MRSFHKARVLSMLKRQAITRCCDFKDDVSLRAISDMHSLHHPLDSLVFLQRFIAIPFFRNITTDTSSCCERMTLQCDEFEAIACVVYGVRAHVSLTHFYF